MGELRTEGAFSQAPGLELGKPSVCPQLFLYFSLNRWRPEWVSPVCPQISLSPDSLYRLQAVERSSVPQPSQRVFQHEFAR
jgi:hypothetical protein